MFGRTSKRPEISGHLHVFPRTFRRISKTNLDFGRLHQSCAQDDDDDEDDDDEKKYGNVLVSILVIYWLIIHVD